jgi:hypothetical protein
MRFHRLFVLAAYGSLAIVLIAVLFPTAKGQSQHLASTRPWVGIAGTAFLTRSLIQTCVRQPTLQTGLVSAIDQLHYPRSNRRPFPTFQCQPRFSCRLRRDVDPCSQKLR